MKIRSLALLISILLMSVALGIAQDQPPSDMGRPHEDGPPPADGGRPNLFRALGLSREQLQQLKQMNAQRKPQMEAAQRALRDAVKALDITIYADTVDEAEVAARIKDFQSSQAEIARIRFNSELTVRQILTPEQLVKFRELRRRFEEERAKTRDARRNGNRPPPFQQINRQNRPPKSGP